MAPSGRRVDGLSQVAMGSSEMVRFGLQFQATGTWKEVKVTLSHKQLETFVWIQTKGRKKQRDFFSPAAKIRPGYAPGVPLTSASISEGSVLSGEVIKLKMCHRLRAQVTQRATPPSSPPPRLPGRSPAEDPPPAPPHCQSSEVSKAAPATSTVQFFVCKYSSKEKLEMKSPATKRPLWKEHESHTMTVLYPQLTEKGTKQKRQRHCLNGQGSFPDGVKGNTLKLECYILKLESFKSISHYIITRYKIF